MLYIQAGAASMASAWFIHWPVRALHGPLTSLEFAAFGKMRACGGAGMRV